MSDGSYKRHTLWDSYWRLGWKLVQRETNNKQIKLQTSKLKKYSVYWKERVLGFQFIIHVHVSRIKKKV